MATKAGSAYIDVRENLDHLGKELDSKGPGIFGGLGKKASAAFGAALGVGVAGKFLSDMQDLGTEVDTFRRKAATVFEAQNADVAKWSQANAAAFGLTDDKLSGLAANFGDLLKPMGFTSAEAARMSTEVVGLSGALSAWSGGQRSAAEVSEILAKAMLGETDSLKGLGISISAADIKARLAAKGQEELTGAALDMASAAATQELIFEKSTDAQKAWADGSFDAVKKQNALKEKIAELKEDIADRLRPAFLAVFSLLVDKGIPAFDSLGARASSFFPKIKAGVQGVYGILVKGDFTGKFGAAFGLQEDSKVVATLFRIREGAIAAFNAIKGVDLEPAKRALASIEWDKVFVGASLAGDAVGFLAGHADTLARFLPLLVAGFVAFKLAQAANNAVGKDSLIGFALQTAATIALALSNRSLAASIASSTLATNVGATSMVRAAATTAGAAAASVATQIAGWIALGVQATLGAAKVAAAWVISLGPIALVVAAVVGLAALFVVHWDTIKSVVAAGAEWVKEHLAIIGQVAFVALTGGLGLLVIAFVKNFDSIKDAVREGVAWVVDKFLALAEWTIKAAAAAFGWVRGIGPKLRDAADKVEAFRNEVNAAIRGIDSEKTVRINFIEAVSRENNTNLGTAGDPIAPGAGSEDNETESLPDRARGIEEGPLPGRRGEPVLVRAHAGEWVVTDEQMEDLTSGRSGGASPAAPLNEERLARLIAAELAANPSRSYVVASDVAKGLRGSRRP